MSDHTRKDKIRNKIITKKIEITLIIEKSVETRLM